MFPFHLYILMLIRLLQRTEALSRWGSPKSEDDLTQLFLSHLHSEISSTPFSPSPLSSESFPILPHLEALTRRGWWTIFSQPAVDGVPSSDEVFGWGPVGGYVFQKGFVEFFAEKADVDIIEQRIRSEGDGWVDFFAANEEVRYLLLPHSNCLNLGPGEDTVKCS